ALTDAQANMSSQAFQQLESFVTKAYGQADDSTILNTYASQLQQSGDTQDAGIVQMIAQSDVPAQSATTTTATAGMPTTGAPTDTSSAVMPSTTATATSGGAPLMTPANAAS
ncbi:MAG TPA: hypothetical protein V6C72_12525, partial [Chroococcales cyanobacterium]